MDENDSELETLMVPMLDSSPGGKKSFSIETTQKESSDLDTVDNDKRFSGTINICDNFLNGWKMINRPSMQLM